MFAMNSNMIRLYTSRATSDFIRFSWRKFSFGIKVVFPSTLLFLKLILRFFLMFSLSAFSFANEYRKDMYLSYLSKAFGVFSGLFFSTRACSCLRSIFCCWTSSSNSASIPFKRITVLFGTVSSFLYMYGCNFSVSS